MYAASPPRLLGADAQGSDTQNSIAGIARPGSCGSNREHLGRLRPSDSQATVYLDLMYQIAVKDWSCQGRLHERCPIHLIVLSHIRFRRG